MDLEQTAKKIESMQIRGAARIARSAAEALKDFTMNFEGSNVEQFRHDLNNAGNRLLSTRPTAVSLENAVSLILKGAKQGDNIREIRENVVTFADKFINKSEKALDIIAEIGAKRIMDSDVILTHCNSSCAVSTIIKAFEAGKKIQVYATESRPKRQGYITVRELVKAKVPTTLIVDSAVRHIMPNIDLTVVGADTIASNGAVINKIGTSQIALCAHEARVPLMVCAETFKFSKKTMMGESVEIEERDVNEIVRQEDFPGVKIFNPVFDVTPPQYIDVIVTEEGVISPYAAIDIIKSMEVD